MSFEQSRDICGANFVSVIKNNNIFFKDKRRLSCGVLNLYFQLSRFSFKDEGI